MVLLDDDIWFPSHEHATEDGILAVGGDLSVERLLLAYENGIFPWYSDDEPILWWSPPERMVVKVQEYKIPRSVSRSLKNTRFEISINQDFSAVINHCRFTDRKDGLGTWINDDIVAAYTQLHQMGKANSIEVWQDDQLVGGMYGVDVGNVFCGESMFSLVPSASKAAFVFMVQYLKDLGYQLLDCQVYNEHLDLLGAKEISRDEFLAILSDPHE